MLYTRNHHQQHSVLRQCLCLQIVNASPVLLAVDQRLQASQAQALKMLRRTSPQNTTLMVPSLMAQSLCQQRTTQNHSLPFIVSCVSIASRRSQPPKMMFPFLATENRIPAASFSAKLVSDASTASIDAPSQDRSEPFAFLPASRTSITASKPGSAGTHWFVKTFPLGSRKASPISSSSHGQEQEADVSIGKNLPHAWVW
mmetsp:Transcript_28867/g.79228  ORF Transcript_28867/g.79228 Transcript_28867/m.79228 type:complete len:200 (+) Transcript_28867:139-738(+)